MRTGTFLFALWSMAVVGLFMLATSYAWSPFADSGRTGARGAAGGVFVGPRHK
jgi:hypothetical protein